MPTQTSYQHGTPVEYLEEKSAQRPNQQTPDEEKVRSYVVGWRNKLRTERVEKVNIWNECWALYRGQEDFSNKEDWQSQIVLPKAWSSVKQATNVIKRLLNTPERPWRVEPTSQHDELWQLRGEKMTALSKVFLDKAHFLEEFSTGLECGFIMGLGVWKIGWNLIPRTRIRTQMMLVSPFNPTQQQPYGPPQPLETPSTNPFGPPQGGYSAMQGPTPGGPSAPGSPAPQPEIPEQPAVQRGAPTPVGQNPRDLMSQQSQQYPNQMGGEALGAPGSLNGMGGPQAPQTPQLIPTKQIIREEILEGNLMLQAVDPYNFYWLPGSKLNRWTGTIEEIEVPKWQLMEMAEVGAFDPELIKKIGPMQIPENDKQSYLRFGEMPRTAAGPTEDTGIVKLTEFYGPLVIDGKLTEKYAHIIIANDTWVLKNGRNDKWHRKPTYAAFSPLNLPFRTEGVGLIEQVRHIDKALDQITNLGVDTLLFRLLPIFEFTPEVYENPEDFRTGMTPGKLFRRNSIAGSADIGIRPIQFEDVSPGASQMAGLLDRAHQEGALVSEIQQSLPRWSGAQTATETDAIQQNQSSFFGSLASDIEQFAIAPIIEMAVDTIMQYVDTANDPRIAAILGVDQQVLQGMSQPEVFEMIQGDYEIKVEGLSSQLQKAEMLQNLVQLMNLIGQNPETWEPYINQDALLRRVLDSFRPIITDIEQIIATPDMVAASKEQAQMQQEHQQMVGMIPQLVKMAHDATIAQTENARTEAQMEHDKNLDVLNAQQKAVDQALQYKQIKDAAKKPAAKK